MQFEQSKHAVRFIKVSSLTDQSRQFERSRVVVFFVGEVDGYNPTYEWDTWRIAWRINLAWDEHTQSTYYDAMICMNDVHVSMNEIN